MSSIVTVTGSGQITLPAEYRRKHGIEKGDKVVVKESDDGDLVVQVKPSRAKAMRGSFRLKPGVHADDDFGNVIREAMEERADAIVDQLHIDRAGSDR